jgi:hypothetical protein
MMKFLSAGGCKVSGGDIVLGDCSQELAQIILDKAVPRLFVRRAQSSSTCWNRKFRRPCQG